jgi:broad specificity phosphatase PhoE
LDDKTFPARPAEPRYLILIRHAQTRPEPGRPARLWELTETGRLRCRNLAAYLKAYRLPRIVTSTEAKAAQTGQLVAGALGIPAVEADGLQEQARETVGFLPTAEAFEAAVSRLFENPDALVFGEETANQALRRFAGAVERIIAAQPEGDIAIASHGTVISLFVADKTGLDPVSFWRELRQPALVIFSLPEFELVQVVNDFQSD